MSKNAYLRKARQTHSSGYNRPHRGQDDDVQLDFNPYRQLKKIIHSRPVQEGITIDFPGTYIIDDGLWVQPHNKDGWCITASIADLPAMIPQESRLESFARARMEEDNTSWGPVRRIWPVDFMKDFVSLRMFEDRAARPAITFTTILDRNMNVQNCKIRRTAFVNRGQHTDGSFRSYKDFSQQMILEWRRLARGLYQKRCRDLGYQFDSRICSDAQAPLTHLTKDNGDMEDGKLLVHEVMRLTNRMAAEYFNKHGLVVPFKSQNAGIRATLVSPCYEFDMAANSMCIKLLQDMTENGLPYVHLNSPMRKYSDYLALKVLGEHLSGRSQSAQTRNEVQSLSPVFRRHAKVPDFLLQPRWQKQWKGQLCNQLPWHPHPIPRQQESYDLVKTCKKMQVGAPLMAEREIMMQGTVLYFTALQVADERLRTWAVSHNADQAAERAAERMNVLMGRRGMRPEGA